MLLYNREISENCRAFCIGLIKLNLLIHSFMLFLCNERVSYMAHGTSLCVYIDFWIFILVPYPYSWNSINPCKIHVHILQMEVLFFSSTSTSKRCVGILCFSRKIYFYTFIHNDVTTGWSVGLRDDMITFFFLVKPLWKMWKKINSIKTTRNKITKIFIVVLMLVFPLFFMWKIYC